MTAPSFWKFQPPDIVSQFFSHVVGCGVTKVVKEPRAVIPLAAFIIDLIF